MKKNIPVTRSWMPPFDDYCREIEDLWDSRWLTNMGDKHRRLEEALAEYLDVPYVALFTNGHLALETALQALELQGEVLTTPFTFASTTHAIVRCGLTPVFVDIRSDDYTLDAKKLEECITDKTCAIVPVHVYGHLCNYEAIADVAHRYGLKVIYDAAHTFGMKVNGKGVGQLGDVSMFSFHATKVFHTIEGGALTMKDPDLYQKVVRWRNFGLGGPEEIVNPGGNGKMSEFQAVMGLCLLPRVDDEIARRRALVDEYRKQLASVPGVQLSPDRTHVDANGAYFPIVLREYPVSRDELAHILLSEGIVARKYFYPLTSDAVWHGKSLFKDTPVARSVADRVLCLPLFGEMDMEDVERIVSIVRTHGRRHDG